MARNIKLLQDGATEYRYHITKTEPFIQEETNLFKLIDYLTEKVWAMAINKQCFDHAEFQPGVQISLVERTNDILCISLSILF